MDESAQVSGTFAILPRLLQHIADILAHLLAGVGRIDEASFSHLTHLPAF